MADPFSFPFLISASGGTYPATFVPHEEDGFLDVVVDDVLFTLEADGINYGLSVESDEQQRVVDHLRSALKVTSEPETFWFSTEPSDAYAQALSAYEQTT